MLPFEEWFKQIREWVRKGEWEKVRTSAHKRTQAKENERKESRGTR